MSRALGLVTALVRCFVCKIPLLARALGLKARPSARATLGYLIYNALFSL